MTAFSFHFTKSRLARISYAQTRSLIYRDTDVRGLRLKVGKRRKTFNFVKRIKDRFGAPITFTLGTFPSMTVEDARKKANHLAYLCEQGIDPRRKTKRRTADSPLPLKDAMDQFLEIKRSQVTAHTLKDYRAVFRNHLSDWMERDLRMISADDLANRYNHIKNKSVKQAKAAMILLNQMWNRLGPLLRVDGERVLPPNPIPEVRQMLHGWTKTIPNQPIIPLYQLGGWVARLEDHLARPQTRLGKRSLCGVLLMSLFCGFRNGECRKLKWSDVDLENGFIKLTLTKNRRGHFVAITPYTRKLLTHFHEIRQPGHPYVFPSPVRRGGRMNPIGRGGKNLELLRQEMGFYFSPHSTRRTFASIGGKLRIPKHIIKRLLNHHYQGDVTDLYIKFLEFDPTQMKEYLEEIAEFIIGERDAYRRKLKSK